MTCAPWPFDDVPDPDPRLAADRAAWQRRLTRARGRLETVTADEAILHMLEGESLASREARRNDQITALAAARAARTRAEKIGALRDTWADRERR